VSGLAAQLGGYLALRRALGYKLDEAGRLLGNFVGFLDRSGADHIGVEVALTWASQSRSADQAGRRLSLMRHFATYLAALDARTEVPPAQLLPVGHERRSPYLFAPAQVQALMDAARALRPVLRGETLATVIGLLAATGIRPGEAYRLGRGDVDLDTGELTLANSKYGRSRRIPMHPTTTAALAGYLAFRDQSTGPEAESFFVTMGGRALDAKLMGSAFRSLLRRCAITAGPGQRAPRPYDLRHSFAEATLLDWHAAGVDVERSLPVLSAYLGHIRPANTYWYLQASPELMAVVAARLERAGRP
jgi:integrase/recombinase XerD